MITSAREARGFCSDALPDGSVSWTLTTLLGKFLVSAELQFGQRDMTWTPLGVEFHGDIPHLWFPGDCRHVAVRLTENARLNSDEAAFQLAHETVHLLSPVVGTANVLEEGLATIFAHANSPIRSNQQSYLDAEALAHCVLSADPDAIKSLRTKRKHFLDFTPEFILDHYTVSVAPATALCKTFIR